MEPSDGNNWAALGLALDEVGDWTRARAVFWSARRRFPHSPFAHSQLGQALLRHGEDDAALLTYAEAARRIHGSGGHNPKLDGLSNLLDLAKAGRLPERCRQEPTTGPAGDPAVLSGIAGNGLAHAAALGGSTLFRHAGELERADGAIHRLPAGPERDAEQGLWIVAKDGWGVAADWTPLTQDLPQYVPIIRSLAG